MRIIAGSRKGHKLFEFDGMDIRPTTDRVKESIFNLIQEYVSGSIVLDLFGGSGALSFEALSRGAEEATCVDRDIRSINLIKKNQAVLKFDNLIIKNSEAMEFLKTQNKRYSLVFLDPPYNKGYILPILTEIVKQDVLTEYGIIVLESDFSDDHGEIDGLNIIKEKKYGRTYVTIYQRG